MNLIESIYWDNILKSINLISLLSTRKSHNILTVNDQTETVLIIYEHIQTYMIAHI